MTLNEDGKKNKKDLDFSSLERTWLSFLVKKTNKKKTNILHSLDRDDLIMRKKQSYTLNVFPKKKDFLPSISSRILRTNFENQKYVS